MPIADLTLDFKGERFAPEIIREDIPLVSGLTRYTGVVYKITHDGMSGSYIDFPGHIAETDDGIDAANFPLEQVYRVPAAVIRLNCKSGHGAVTAADLEKTWGGMPHTPALIINALGELDCRDIVSRSVYLDDSAVQWIIDNGCRLLVSDIYESQALHGVFLKLFQAGVSTVCRPYKLGQLPEEIVKLTVLFAKIPGVTQLPCRVVAEY